MAKDYFKVIKSTNIKDLNEKSTLPESDLTIQSDDRIIQFELVEEDENEEKLKIKTGCYSFVSTQAGLVLNKFNLRNYELLKTITNTKTILDESDKFFSRLGVYEKLKREPKRAVLLCSPPGIGKTCSINEVCKMYLKEEGTSVLIWDTSSIRSQLISNFFLNRAEFDPSVKKMILVIEDIGGGSVDEYGGGPRGADSALLNLLDGVGSPFQGVPTFIISTTNNPETSVEALTDRPGRFDKVIELKSPSKEECEELLEFIKKEKLTEDDVAGAQLAATNEFSIAHLQEAVVRSQIDDITILEAIRQLVKHKKRFKNAFQQQVRGIGLT